MWLGVDAAGEGGLNHLASRLASGFPSRGLFCLLSVHVSKCSHLSCEIAYSGCRSGRMVRGGLVSHQAVHLGKLRAQVEDL